MVTASAFVEKVWIPLLEQWGYIYGMSGRVWTEALQKVYSEPGHKNYEQTKQYGSKWIGDKVVDCSGLPLWALKQLGESIVHQARYQYTDYSAPKGLLVNGQRDDGQPLLPGTAVFLQGSKAHIHHVGVYVGHGICIEAKGTRWGVVTSKPDNWDHWGELKMVDYTDAARIEDEPAPEIPERKSDTEVLYRAVVDNPGAWLNVRSGPGTSFPVVYRVEKGDEVDVLAESTDKGWWQICFGGRIGWASAQYLQPVDDAPEAPDDAPDDEPDDGPEYSRDDLTALMEALTSAEKAFDQARGELAKVKRLAEELTKEAVV